MSQVSRFKFLAVPSRCLGHIVNLANIDVMAHITNIVVVENKTAIWEFNNALQINHVANGGLCGVRLHVRLSVGKAQLLRGRERRLLRG